MADPRGGEGDVMIDLGVFRDGGSLCNQITNMWGAQRIRGESVLERWLRGRGGGDSESERGRWLCSRQRHTILKVVIQFRDQQPEGAFWGAWKQPCDTPMYFKSGPAVGNTIR